jgi:hypothetical protein
MCLIPQIKPAPFPPLIRQLRKASRASRINNLAAPLAACVSNRATAPQELALRAQARIDEKMAHDPDSGRT